MNIIQCTDSDTKRWNDYLHTQPSSNFYQLYGWCRINQHHFGHKNICLAVHENEEIKGVFPLTYVRSRLFGNILSSMPFVNFGGPCASNQEIEAALIDEAIAITKKLGADYLEIRSTRALRDTFPTSLHKVSMTIPLNSNPDELWNEFTPKHRKNVRRAYKNNLHVVTGHKELLPIFYRILTASWRALGTPIYKQLYFEHILDEFKDQVKIFVCYQGKTPIAAAFVGYHMDTVEGMWIGSLPEARDLQYSYVLYWEMIKDACEGGFAKFHLGRSTKDSGGEQFKKKWKAEQLQLYWQYYLNKVNEMPSLNVDNPKFNLAIKAWRKLPLKITTTVGPWLAKNIP